jgi:hypothetical protein
MKFYHFSWLYTNAKCCTYKRKTTATTVVVKMMVKFIELIIAVILYQYSVFLYFQYNKSSYWSSINDVTSLGGRGYQGFCDNSTKALVIKSVAMGGGGVKNKNTLRDVIYITPLRCLKHKMTNGVH